MFLRSCVWEWHRGAVSASPHALEAKNIPWVKVKLKFTPTFVIGPMKICSYGPRYRAQMFLGGPCEFLWHPDPIAIFFQPNNSELKI